MHIRKIHPMKWLLPLVVIICMTGGIGLYSQYLLDDEVQKEEEKKEEIKKTEPDNVTEKIPDNIAHNIKAARVTDNSDIKCGIKVSWDLRPEYLGEYVVVRGKKVLDTREKIKSAKVIQTVKTVVNNQILDSECKPGVYYYAVVSKKNLKESMFDLHTDQNFTSVPVSVGSEEELISVTGIKSAAIENYRIRLTWKKAVRTGVLYSVYRSTKVIDSDAKLKKAEKVKTLTDASEYIDAISTSGTYFYAVTAKVMLGKEEVALVPNENYTKAGITMTIVDRFMIETIAASALKKGVQVSWVYKGSGGDRFFRLFRTAKFLKSSKDLMGTSPVQEVDVSDKEYLDLTAPEGSYYYALIPGSVTERDDVELVPGVNITIEAVRVRAEKKEVIKKEEIKKDKKPIIVSDIDSILRRTFFRGLFNEALKELQDFADATDNEGDKAKARLFMGRSYIEKGEYQKALRYLVLPDVKKYFPREADFWEEFALLRLKSY